MREILEAKGWKMYYHCMCQGIYQERYNHVDKTGMKIIIRPKKNRFKVRKNNLSIKEDHSYNLEEYLNTI